MTVLPTAESNEATAEEFEEVGESSKASPRRGLPRLSAVVGARDRRLAVLIVSSLLVLVGLFRADQSDVGDFGLIAALPWYVFVAALGLVFVTVSAVLSDEFSESFVGSGVTAIVVLLSAAPAVVYDTTRYSWAFKHIGIVDYIDRTGGVDTSIEVLPVYHNWPGFFAGAATLTRWVGAENAIVVAEWAPVVLNLLTLGALVFLFGTLVEDRRVVWLAGLLFFLTNWIGQDYFSPQALAYLLYLNVLALALRYFGREGPALPLGPAHGVLALLMLVISASHQLTPIVLFVVLLGLWVLRQVRGLWIPALSGLCTLAWAVTWARPFVITNIEDELEGVGSPLDNAGETLAKAVERSESQVWVAMSGRGLLLGLGMIALAGLGARFATNRKVGAPIALLAGPVSLLILEFGGEILFRVALFMLPMLSLLAAEFIVGIGRPDLRRAFGIGVALLFLPLLGMASFGKDSFYAFTAAELDVVTEVMTTAPEGSLLVEASRNYPSQFVNYENFVYVAIDRESDSTQLRIAANPGDELFRWLDQDEYAATYVILSTSQDRQARALGSLPAGFVSDVERALRTDERFEVLVESDEAVVFVLAAS